MRAMRELGANTLDLYVPWNWHELRRRRLRLRPAARARAAICARCCGSARSSASRFIVRPGPVIRNEWRNGGYPAWLLQRPEYGMPLHDVLEGRYPATATLQNAHSDDAAARMAAQRDAPALCGALAASRAGGVPAGRRPRARGAARRRPGRVPRQSDRIPRRILHAYLRWLEAQVRDVVGPRTPAFINTFDMKVPVVVAGVGDGELVPERRLLDRRARPRGACVRDRDAAHAATRCRSRTASFKRAGWPDPKIPSRGRPIRRTRRLRSASCGLGHQRRSSTSRCRTRSRRSAGRRRSRTRSTTGTPRSASAATMSRRRSGLRTLDRLYTTRRLFGALALYGPAFAEARRVARRSRLPYDGRGNAVHGAAASLKSAARVLPRARHRVRCRRSARVRRRATAHVPRTSSSPHGAYARARAPCACARRARRDVRSTRFSPPSTPDARCSRVRTGVRRRRELDGAPRSRSIARGFGTAFAAIAAVRRAAARRAHRRRGLELSFSTRRSQPAAR